MIIHGIKIQGVTSDSRVVKKDYIFVAVTGEKENGNNFIEDAIKNGAKVIYTEEEIYRSDCIIEKVKDSRQKLAELCNEFYNYPSEKLFIIGITGTNGKTTTTHLIYHILKEYGIDVGLLGTLSIKIGNKSFPSNLTTPIAEDIFYYLNEMVKNDMKIVVMEVSSHGLKNQRVHGIEFDIGIHTNIENDHLNFHKTFINYIESKKKLFDNLSLGKIALINHDDKHSFKLLEGNDHIIVITYGLGSKCTVTASSIDLDFSTSFNYCLQRKITTLADNEIDGFEYPIRLNLLGNHNIYNALSAITACLLLDVPIENIAKYIQSFPALYRRMEIIYQSEYIVIDDFCHNPSSYEAVFQSVQNLQYKNLHIVNGIRGNRGIDINKENAETIKQWYEILNVKNLIITDSCDIVDNLNKVSSQEREIVFETFKNSPVIYKYKANLREAIKEALNEVEDGDILLLLGAQSMDSGRRIFLELIDKENKFSIINPNIVEKTLKL